MTKAKKYVIIVAGGMGVRMGMPTPKQFLLLGEKPILMHTLEAFYNTDPEIKLLLVLPADQFEYWNKLCRAYKFNLPHKLVPGGKTRTQSVRNGLGLVPDESIVAIHDGVRPLVSAGLINRCFEAASAYGTAIPVTKMTESIRKVTGTSSVCVSRDEYRLVQTPQVFRADIILESYRKAGDEHYTDDAAVAEAAGYNLKLVEGERENIKITLPVDLKIAEVLMKREAE